MAVEKCPKVVAFDCDGVIFDSKEANIRFYEAVLAKFGCGKLQPHQVEFVHMHSVRESIYYLFSDQRLAEEAWKYALSMEFESFFPYMRLHKGLGKCLTELKGSFFLAVATNRTVSTKEVLEYFNLANFFDYVVCAADVKNPKPHRDMMDMITKRFGVKPEDVIYIGDSKVDEIFARNSGVFFVAFKNPLLNADLHIESFGEFTDWIRNLCKSAFLQDNYRSGNNGT